MALINCSECGQQISDKAINCVKCGAPVVKKETFKCFECGIELEKGTKTCSGCGAEQDANPNILEPPIVEQKQESKHEESTQENKTEPKKETKIVPPKPHKTKSKKGLTFFLGIALVLAIGFIYLSNHGYNMKTIFNTPQTIDLSVSCSPVNYMLITSEVTVTVRNNSSRTHNNVTVRLTAYDENNNIIKEKTSTFERTLEPHGELSKPISLPAKTYRCDAVIESSNPN